jgi:hypothetical protein
MTPLQEEGTSSRTKFYVSKRRNKKAGHIESNLWLQFTVILDPVKQA